MLIVRMNYLIMHNSYLQFMYIIISYFASFITYISLYTVPCQAYFLGELSLQKNKFSRVSENKIKIEAQKIKTH